MPDQTPIDDAQIVLESVGNQTDRVAMPVDPTIAGLTQPSADADFDETDVPPRISILTISLFCILLTGLLLRIASAIQLSSHVDESASIMAAQMVADKGAPIYPSGTLYLQGATISYLLAPFIWLGYGGLDHLDTLRMLSVVAGTLAILAAYFFAKWLTGSQWTGVGVALLLALDPASIRWSALVRMYALLQLISIIMLFLFLWMIRYPPSRRILIGFVAVFWFGVYTHIAICLFLPPMMVLALWKHRYALIGRRIDITIALGAACLAPFTLILANRLVTPPQATPAGTTANSGFVGDYIISFDQVLHPSLGSWRLLFRYGDSGTYMPALVIALSLVLLGRYFLDANLDDVQRERRNIFGTLALLYWMPILLVAAFATESNERYLLHLHPLGLIMIAFAIRELVAGELRTPQMVFAPAAVEQLSIGGRNVPLTATEFGERLAWLTTSRLITVAATIVIGFGAILRIWRYTYFSMWLDEGFALLYSQQSWRSVVGLNGFYSPHPPLYFALTKVFNQFLSDANAGRTLSLFCGLATLPIFFLLSRRLLDPLGSLAATTVFALSPIHLYYSQEARMYSLVVLTVTTSYLALVAFIQTDSRWWAALYCPTLIVAAYADYSALFAIAPQALIILYYIWRNWRRMLPIVIAGILAVIAYLPWLPEVWASVHSANEDDRRSEYLGAGFGRIMDVILRITGVASDPHGPYFPSLKETTWDTFSELRLLILLFMAPVVILGMVGLWRRWFTAAITLSLFGSIVVAALISVVSPSFAERSVLSASVGWSLLLGAAFNGRLRRNRTPFAALSLLFVLAICFSTIDTIHVYGVKSRWDDAAADLAAAAPLDYPIVTYSYGEVANTLVNAYEPGLLQSSRLITVRDGELEKTLSNDILPKTGITVADVDSGKFNELLPDTPDNAFVWFLYYQRIGQENVQKGLIDSGYERIIAKTYASPRNQVFLDLYARPDAFTTTQIPDIPSFSDTEAWGIPANASQVVPAADGSSVSILNLSRVGTAIATQINSSGAALYVVDADVDTLGIGASATVTLTCLSSTGVSLNESTAPTPGRRGLLHHRSAIVCPIDTGQVKITIKNSSTQQQVWSNVTLGKTVITEPASSNP